MSSYVKIIESERINTLSNLVNTRSLSTATYSLLKSIVHIPAIANIATFDMPRPGQVTCPSITEHLPSSRPTMTSITIRKLTSSLTQGNFISNLPLTKLLRHQICKLDNEWQCSCSAQRCWKDKHSSTLLAPNIRPQLSPVNHSSADLECNSFNST